MNPSQPAGSSKLFFGYENDEDTAWLDYSEGIAGTTTGNYTYYVVPKTNRGNIFLGISNGGGGYFECEIGSVTVEHIVAAFQPMYSSVLSTVTDYYAFGSPMPGRNYNSPNYRYGFNGKEKDSEIKGEGNSLDFGARIYDPRLGRWLSLDPLMSKYPDLSPYNFTANNPLIYVDPDGKDIVPASSIQGKRTLLIVYQMKENSVFDKYVRAYKNNLGTRNISLYEDWSMPEGMNGNTSKVGNSGNLTIGFNEHYEYNDLSRAMTIIHEGIHAYLIANGNSKAESSHHTLMTLKKYRDDIIAGGKEFAKQNGIDVSGMSNKDWSDLSWRGLEGTAAFNKQFKVKTQANGEAYDPIDNPEMYKYKSAAGNYYTSAEHRDWADNVDKLEKDKKLNMSSEKVEDAKKQEAGNAPLDCQN